MSLVATTREASFRETQHSDRRAWNGTFNTRSTYRICPFPLAGGVQRLLALSAQQSVQVNSIFARSFYFTGLTRFKEPGRPARATTKRSMHSCDQAFTRRCLFKIRRALQHS